MLNDFKYIAFDFETTGLDVQKDEPIQIGLVVFSADGQIIDTFQSLIQPKKSINELKDIVRFLTGFSLQDLQDAPSIEALIPILQEYFDENTIVVGQNIGFDLAMLQKYMPFTPLGQVDTYPLAKQLMHYIPSYALDVLHSSLINKDLIESTISEGSAHDALYDSLMSYDLFLYLIRKFDKLRRKYLILDSMIQKSDGLFSLLIKRSQKKFSYDEKKLFLPPLKRTLKSDKKVTVNDPIKRPDHTDSQFQTVDVSKGSAHRLISSIDRTSRKWVVATTHKSKQTRIQSILDSLFVPWATLYDQLIFDDKRVDLFLHKDTYTDEEIGFIAKYFSHFESNHSQVDTNTPQEYRILKALCTLQPRKTNHVQLCTHEQLWSFKDKITPDHTVLFLDSDRWYQSYARVQKQSFDPYKILHLLEDYQYSYDLSKSPLSSEIQNITGSYSIFLGVLSSEINQYFVGHSDNTVEIDFLLEDTRAPKTSHLFVGLSQALTTLSESLDENQSTPLMEALHQLTEHLTGLTTIQKRMYQGDKWYYQFNHRERYVDYQDFLNSLPDAQYYFTTLQAKKQGIPLIIPPARIPVSDPTLHTITKPTTLAAHLKASSHDGSVFILSSLKQQSQALFKEIIAQSAHENNTLIAENITGGVGKNVFHALHSDKPVIALGGYAFYLELVAKKFAFSRVYCYHIFGAMKSQIISDMLRYAS